MKRIKLLIMILIAILQLPFVIIGVLYSLMSHGFKSGRKLFYEITSLLGYESTL